MAENTHQIDGTVLLVQEHRFRLMLDDGGVRLFVLAAGAPVLTAELERFAAEAARVQVRYRAVPGLIAAAALDVRERDAPSAAASAAPSAC